MEVSRADSPTQVYSFCMGVIFAGGCLLAVTVHTNDASRVTAYLGICSKER